MKNEYRKIVVNALIARPDLPQGHRYRLLGIDDRFQWDWESLRRAMEIPDSDWRDSVAALLLAQIKRQTCIALIASPSPLDGLDFCVTPLRHCGPQTPSAREFFRVLVEHNFSQSLYEAAAADMLGNPHHAAEWIELALASQNPTLLDALAPDPRLPVGVIRLLAQDVRYWYALADNPALPRDLVDRLIEDDAAPNGVDTRLARRPDADHTMLLAVCRSGHVDAIEAVASKTGLSPQALRVLLNRRNYLPAVEFAARSCTDTDLLIALAHDESPHVRAAATHNPALPQQEIDRLCEDSDEDVLQTLASNIRISDAVRDRFGRSDDQTLRMAAYANARLTPLQKKRLPREREGYELYKLLIAPTLSADALHALTRHRNVDIRMAAARHERCPPDALTELAESSNEDIRLTVAGNPNCTEAIDLKIIHRKPAYRDFHVPLHYARSARSSAVLEGMYEVFYQKNRQALQNYRRLREAGSSAVIVPKDFRAAPLFHAHPLASEQFRQRVAVDFPQLAKANSEAELKRLFHYPASDGWQSRLHALLDDWQREEVLKELTTDERIDPTVLEYLAELALDSLGALHDPREVARYAFRASSDRSKKSTPKTEIEQVLDQGRRIRSLEPALTFVRTHPEFFEDSFCREAYVLARLDPKSPLASLPAQARSVDVVVALLLGHPDNVSQLDQSAVTEALADRLLTVERDSRDAVDVLLKLGRCITTTRQARRIVEINGEYLEHVPEPLLTLELCYAAVRCSGRAVRFVPPYLLSTDLCMEAVKAERDAIRWVPDAFKTIELCRLAVNENSPENLQYVPAPLQDEAMIRLALRFQKKWEPAELNWIQAPKLRRKYLRRILANHPGSVAQMTDAEHLATWLSARGVALAKKTQIDPDDASLLIDKIFELVQEPSFHQTSNRVDAVMQLLQWKFDLTKRKLDEVMKLASAT